MAEQINSGSGVQYPLIINEDGNINTIGAVTISGTPTLTISGNIIIGSVTANVDSIYVQSGLINIDGIGSVLITNSSLPLGSTYIFETNPTDTNRFNYKTELVYSGNAVGSIYKEHATGSWLQVLTYDGSDNVINVSEWSIV